MRDATKSLWGPNYPDWVIKRWGKIITQSQIDQGSCTPILTIRLVEEKLGRLLSSTPPMDYPRSDVWPLI